MPSGMIAPKTTSIPPSARLKPVRTSSGTGALSRSPRSGRVTSSQMISWRTMAAMKATA
jgi:hypothetical protein